MCVRPAQAVLGPAKVVFEIGKDIRNAMDRYSETAQTVRDPLVHIAAVPPQEDLEASPRISGDEKISAAAHNHQIQVPVSYTHLTLPTNREV